MSLLEIYLDPKADDGNVFAKSCFTKYFEYLRCVESRLPASARQFAMAPWHYDEQDHRCPHDSWLEALTISKPSSGVRCEIRSINILIRLHPYSASRGLITMDILNCDTKMSGITRWRVMPLSEPCMGFLAW